ncbi:MAG: hypothetical protein U0271_47305 [Polyangiaceae bacterium]
MSPTVDSSPMRSPREPRSILGRRRASIVAAMFGVVLALGILAPGCLSPTLPLPPPEEPETVHAESATSWQIVGTCIEGAEVTLLNERTGRGVVVIDLDNLGLYSATLEGEPCDVVLLSQSVGTEDSDNTRFVLEEISDGEPVGPGSCTTP